MANYRAQRAKFIEFMGFIEFVESMETGDMIETGRDSWRYSRDEANGIATPRQKSGLAMTGRVIAGITDV